MLDAGCWGQSWWQDFFSWVVLVEKLMRDSEAGNFVRRNGYLTIVQKSAIYAQCRAPISLVSRAIRVRGLTIIVELARIVERGKMGNF
jgi:hypothetical protein